MDAFALSLRSIAAHQRDHAGNAELAAVIESAADEIARLRSRPLPSEMVEALKWAIGLAEIALEDSRQRRLLNGHNDIGAGTSRLGLWPEEQELLRSARAVLALLQGGDKRCAECDCENGGKDCNWIRQPSTPVSGGK